MMNLLLHQEDIFAIILQYLSPQGLEMLHLKLSSSTMFNLIQNQVPFQHLIFVFRQLQNKQHVIYFKLQTNFKLEPEQVPIIAKLFQSDLGNLITRFVMLFYFHPVSEQFLYYFPTNIALLIALSSKEEFIQQPLFKTVAAIHRLILLINNSKSFKGNSDKLLDETWFKDADWKVSFHKNHLLYVFTSFSTQFLDTTINHDPILLNKVIQNKSLLKLLLLRKQFSLQIQIDQIVSHINWKQDYSKDLEFRLALIGNVCQNRLNEKKYIKSLIKDFHFETEEQIIRLVAVCGSLDFLDEKWRYNKKVVLASIQHNPSVALRACSKLQKDKDIILELVRSNRNSFSYQPILDDYFKHSPDLEFSKSLLKVDGRMIAYYRMKWKLDCQVVLDAVSTTGEALKYCPKPFQKDKHIVVTAIKQNGTAISFADESIKISAEVALLALTNGATLESLPKKYRDDREFATRAIKTSGKCIMNMKQYQNDRDMIVLALESFPQAIQFLKNENEEDGNLILRALHQDSMLFSILPQKLQHDEAMIQAAMNFYVNGTQLIQN